MSLDAADLALFVDPDMPGYVLATIAGVSTPGLFGNPYQEVFGSAGTHPMLRCLSAALVAPVQGMTVVVGGINYLAAEIQANGSGMTSLILEAV